MKKYDARLKLLSNLSHFDSGKHGVDWRMIDWKNWKFRFSYKKGNPNTWHGLWFIWETPFFQLGVYA